MDRDTFLLSFIDYAYALGWNRHSHAVHADDIAQEALLTAWEKREYVASVENPSAYIRAIMIHAANNYSRQNSSLIRIPHNIIHGHEEEDTRLTNIIDLASLFDIEATQETRGDRDFLWLYDLIGRLSNVQRIAISHFYGLEGYEKLSLRQIATLQGCKHQSIMRAIQRGIAKLQQFIG